MEPNQDPEDKAGAREDRRESVSDWVGLLSLVAALCLGFVLLVFAGYGARAIWRYFN